MRKLLSRLFDGRVLVTIGVAALAGLVWIVGPQVAVYEQRPLEPEAPRWWVIGLLGAALLLWLLWGAWRAHRRNAAVVRQLVAVPPARGGTPEPSEAEELRRRFEKALHTLRGARFAGRRNAWQALSARAGRRYLYELPWYTLIGSPGAGKTTALMNAGLRFPLAEAGAGDAARPGLTGVAGTRHIEWWFTDEAVLIDTAGRYTSQDSDHEADAAAWRAFLALLKKSRPRRPVNGVLVTVSVPELLEATPAERERHARSLRARVQELHRELGVRFPIYLLVTKCDLLAGFIDTLGNADRERRAAPWGFTFPLDAQQRSDTTGLAREFDALVQRLVDGLPARLQAERDLERRARQYGFPAQVAQLREPLQAFVAAVFSPSAFEAHPLLRGVYLISGTQEGTPLDRVLGAMARAHGLERAALPPRRGSGKAFFLERLLRDVVFAESEIGGTDLRWERRRMAVAAAGYVALTLVAGGLLLGWATSWWRNRAYVDEVAQRIEPLAAAVARAGSVREPLALLPVLQATRALATGEDLLHRPGAFGFGLNQDDKLDAAAEQAWRRLLVQLLLPRVVDDLAARLAAAGDDPQADYEALKAYLMLHEPARFEARSLRTWLAAHGPEPAADATREADRAALRAALDALLAEGPVTAAQPADAALVARVRQQLAGASLAQRIYGRLKDAGAADGPEDFTVARAVGPTAELVFRRISGKPLTQGVPGRFSPAGWQRLSRQVDTLTQRLGRDEGWVLGTSTDTRMSAEQLQRLGDEVRRLYLADYAAAWQSFIADLGVRPAESLDHAVQMARVLTAPPSPLKQLVVAIAAQTTLDAGRRGGWAGTLIGQAEAAAGKVIGPGTPPGLRPGAKLEDLVDDKFAALRAQAAAPDGKPAPIDRAVAIVDEVLAHLSAAQAALAARMPPPPAKLPEVEMQKLPEPARAIVTTLAGDGIRIVHRGSGAQVADALQTEVGEFCRKAIAGRYPVLRSAAQDIRPADFATLFAPGGAMDRFFQKYLAERVDTSRKPWMPRLVDGKPAAVDPRVLLQFQRAAAIRDTFFPGGAAQPALRVQLTPLTMDPAILGFILDVDGQIVRYAHGPAIPVSVAWPGPRNSAQVQLQVTPPPAAGSGAVLTGPWALLRLFDAATLLPGDDPARFRAVFDIGGRKAEFDVTASSVLNPFRLRELQEFSCPGDGR